MRALLDILRDGLNKAAVQDQLCPCQDLLDRASLQLKILDPGYGEEELIKSMATEVANLRELAGEVADPRELAETYWPESLDRIKFLGPASRPGV